MIVATISVAILAQDHCIGLLEVMLQNPLRIAYAFKRDYVDHNGRPACLEWKAAVPGPPGLAIRWDLRKVLPNLGYDVSSESTPFSRRMGDMKKVLLPMFANCGIDETTNCGDSHTGLTSCRRQDRVPDQLLRDADDDYWVSAPALIAMMGFLATHRTGEDKLSPNVVLDTLLVNTADQDFLKGVNCHTLQPNDRSQCPGGTAQIDCGHVLPLL